jgi:hypothetical protein
MLPILSPDQIQSAENKVISAAQRFSDQETYAALSNGALKPTNSLRKLSLFFDEDDVIRVKSRLSNSEDLSYNMRCPIYVPHKSPLAVAIFWDSHLSGQHSTGVNHIMADVSSKFHVRHGREFFKSLIHGWWLFSLQVALAEDKSTDDVTTA